MKKYQGEDISFCLKYEDPEGIDDWTKFQEVIVFIYTDGCKTIKFSSNGSAGYYSLTTADTENKSYSGKISNQETKLLSPGYITIEIMGIVSDTEKYIDRQHTGICIHQNFIKNS